MKRIVRDTNGGSLEQMAENSLYFQKDAVWHENNVLIQDNAILAFWEWNVNVFASRCRKFWEVLEKFSPMANIKYLWLDEYHQILNFENITKILMLLPNITHVIITNCKDIPVHTIKQLHNTYFRNKFSLIIAENDVIFANNRIGHITYQVCKREQL